VFAAVRRYDLTPDIDPESGANVDVAVRRWDLAFEDVHFHYQMRPQQQAQPPIERGAFASASHDDTVVRREPTSTLCSHRLCAHVCVWQVLCGMSFTVDEGQVAALVGRSGGGKSTMVHLLLRFYDPRSGRITLGGVDFKALHVKSVHKHIGVVSQETQLVHDRRSDSGAEHALMRLCSTPIFVPPHRCYCCSRPVFAPPLEQFNTTIGENLTYGCEPTPSPEEVVAATKAAQVPGVDRTSPSLVLPSVCAPSLLPNPPLAGLLLHPGLRRRPLDTCRRAWPAPLGRTEAAARDRALPPTQATAAAAR
jgi:hypothetical protein